MSAEPNPYAPPPSPDPARRSADLLARPDEPPFATHALMLPGRPPAQGTLTFYPDRLFIERADGGPATVLAHDDFLTDRARFFVGSMLGTAISTKGTPRFAVRLPTDVVPSFRRWIDPRLGEFLRKQTRERSRFSGWLGAVLIAISVPPLATTIVWSSVVTGSGLVAVALADRVVRGRVLFLFHAITWLAFAANNVGRAMARGSTGWLVLSAVWVLLAIGSVRSFYFFGPLRDRDAL